MSAPEWRKLRSPERLAAVRRTALLDTPAEAAFDRLTRLATRTLHVPLALVTVVDAERQYFKSGCGLPEPYASSRECPLEDAFCPRTIELGTPLLVEDTHTDPRVAGVGAVEKLGARAYAGIPLLVSDGHMLGTFCVLDLRPHRWSPEEVAVLEDLAAMAMSELELRATRELEVAARTAEARRVEAVESRERFALLSDVSALLSHMERPEEALQRAAERAVPQLADVCVVDLCSPEGLLPAVALAHVEPAEARRLQALARERPGAGGAACSGSPLLLTRRPPGGWPAAEEGGGGVHALLEHLPATSFLSVPMHGHAGLVGSLSFASLREGRAFREADLRLAEELATRTAAAVENVRLLRQVQHAVHARDEFLQVSAHELRTPLTPLMLQLASLGRALEAAGVREPRVLHHLERAHAQTRRMGALVERILDLASVSTGRLSLSLQRVELSGLVRGVLGRLEDTARAAGCRVLLSEPGPVWGVWDAHRVGQVLESLLLNAYKYGAGGPVEVGVEAPGEGRARVRVRDHGIGVAPEDAPRIFERFERAVSFQHYGGLGLGLFVARQLSRAHGGDLLVHSRPGEGATFTLVMPLDSTPHVAATGGATAEAPAAPATPAAPAPPPAGG
jgi:signal transduction histidine kinase